MNSPERLNIRNHIWAQVQSDTHFINWDDMHVLVKTKLSMKVYDQTRFGVLLATHRGIEPTIAKINQMIHETVNESP